MPQNQSDPTAKDKAASRKYNPDTGPDPVYQKYDSQHPENTDWTNYDTDKSMVDLPKHMAETMAQKAAAGASMQVPKLHSGGVMKKDGLALLKKGETVRTPEQEKAMAEEKETKAEPKAAEKPAKKASPAALMTSEDKGAKPKGEKKDAKSKGGFTETHIQHHSHGGHTVKHKHKDNPDKDVAYSAQDMEGVKAGLDQHIGGGAGQMQEPEPMPNAEQAAAAVPPAGGAPQAAMPQQV